MKRPRQTRPRLAKRQSSASMFGVVALLLGLAGGAAWLIGVATHSANAIGGPFSLVSKDGRAVTDQSFRGKDLLVYFGYTNCRDVCPTTLTRMAAALGALGDRAGRVQPLFITIDPRRDTPAVVGRYAALFTPRLIGLTGTPAEIGQVEAEYHVGKLVFHGGPDDYTIDHPAVLYLMDQSGRFVAAISADATPADIARGISRHL